ncbi:nuclear transport factor 2 family protein [Bizionia myxarmorum]|uniref:Nuclear transport factor 2 family protein n=1 Tax=Bizionia myxarmorum TaxID=291186 RepID=A0A5D0R5W7_9FLAO|nr:nuclear transport factor 2 family protein [Bizionia myxarmorum]TYB76251.1 nuclear transport factor 2 family protein [Bizionia myxarmorum]
MTSKALIKSFYESDLANDETVIDQFYHKDCIIFWNSSKGLSERNFDEISLFFKGVRESYNDLRFDTTHLLEEDNLVTARYTLYACTIESEGDEIPLAHYICIYHIKDNKIHRAYEISQPADKDTIDSNAFSEIKL